MVGLFILQEKPKKRKYLSRDPLKFCIIRHFYPGKTGKMHKWLSVTGGFLRIGLINSYVFLNMVDFSPALLYNIPRKFGIQP